MKLGLAATALAVAAFSAGAYFVSSSLDRQESQLLKLDRQVELITEELRLNTRSEGGHLHKNIRSIAIKSQLDQMDGPVVFLGDSITELAVLPPTICGRPVLNAGIGGLTTSQYLPLIDSVFGWKRVPLAIIALGTNDSQNIYLGVPPLSERYSVLAAAVKTKADALLYVGIPPLETGGTSQYFSESLAEKNNNEIRTFAQSQSRPFIDVRAGMHGEKLTTDGIHLNTAGYEQWRKIVVSAAEKEAGCAPR